MIEVNQIQTFPAGNLFIESEAKPDRILKCLQDSQRVCQDLQCPPRFFEDLELRSLGSIEFSVILRFGASGLALGIWNSEFGIRVSNVRFGIEICVSRLGMLDLGCGIRDYGSRVRETILDA